MTVNLGVFAQSGFPGRPWARTALFLCCPSTATPSCPGYLPQLAGASSLRLVVETEFSGGARAVWLDPHMLLVGSGWI